MSDTKPFREMTADEMRAEYKARKLAYHQHVSESLKWQAKAMNELCALSDVMRKTGVLP